MNSLHILGWKSQNASEIKAWEIGKLAVTVNVFFSPHTSEMSGSLTGLKNLSTTSENHCLIPELHECKRFPQGHILEIETSTNNGPQKGCKFKNLSTYVSTGQANKNLITFKEQSRNQLKVITERKVTIIHHTKSPNFNNKS